MSTYNLQYILRPPESGVLQFSSTVYQVHSTRSTVYSSVVSFAFRILCMNINIFLVTAFFDD